MKFSLETMSERERRMVMFGGVAAVALLIFGCSLPLNSSVTKAQERVGKKQADLAWMQSVGPELAAAGPTVARPSTNESLLVVVDRARARVGSRVARSRAVSRKGPGLLRVRLEKAPFDIMVGWLARLADQNGISVETANIDNSGRTRHRYRESRTAPQMKRGLRISILAILAFAIILLVRLPASWVKGFLPAGVTCAEIAGTAWNGSCSGLAYNGAPLGNLNWELHPLALFRGKVAAFVDLTRGENFIRGDIEVGSGNRYVAHDLQAQMPLDPPLLPQLDSGYAGNISVNLANLQVEKNLVTAIEGQVQATSLYSKRDRLALGGYSATLPEGRPPAVSRSARCRASKARWTSRARSKLTAPARLDARRQSPHEARNTAVLHAATRLSSAPPDAQGFRQLTLEGTF